MRDRTELAIIHEQRAERLSDFDTNFQYRVRPVGVPPRYSDDKQLGG